MEFSDDVLATLTSSTFWRVYTFDESDGFDLEGEADRLQEQVGELDLHFPPAASLRLTLNLVFDIGMYSLLLSSTDEDGADHPDDHVDSADELGYWDQVRWAPWCLRWEELRAALAPLPAGASADLALLLLARFVGHGLDESAQLAERRQDITAAFERLGLFHGADAAEMATLVLSEVPEPDYAWQRDPKRGWVFGGDYPCYSHRNADHGVFPFDRWAEYRRSLGLD
ncbi:hypothetical protein [Actinophytocola sp.]|uniref:hypothetical protein n=1 Tax=Actinophytocola sp. TaxID=1872138 RepID=UPI003D6B7596